METAWGHRTWTAEVHTAAVLAANKLLPAGISLNIATISVGISCASPQMDMAATGRPSMPCVVMRIWMGIAICPAPPYGYKPAV